MKLSEKAKKKMTVRAKNRLALEMDCSVHTIERWISENEENGSLTKAKAVQIISEETELSYSEVLEEEVEAVK